MSDASTSPEATTLDAMIDALESQLGSERVARLGSVAPLCTYRVGGRAAAVVTADSIEMVEAISNELTDRVPVLVVGRGSNLLVSDAGVDGIVLRLGEGFESIDIDPDTATAHLGGAVLLPVAARRTAAAGLSGFEWAVGVPGSIGGALRMNAGGHGADMADSVVAATIHRMGRRITERVPAADLDLAYRSSNIGPSDVVVSVEVALEHGERAESEAKISEIVRWRRANQPGGQNAGSVFANPDGDSAGRLIDTAGLRGFRLGTAEVSTKHANFIQADPDGSADDVAALIREVQRRVRETHGIVLRPENVLVGFDAESDPS